MKARRGTATEPVTCVCSRRGWQVDVPCLWHFSRMPEGDRRRTASRLQMTTGGAR